MSEFDVYGFYGFTGKSAPKLFDKLARVAPVRRRAPEKSSSQRLPTALAGGAHLIERTHYAL
ncbi:MAG: hypothetical protein HYS04_19340 [Acidobacteria bacterium]|nr:hypothetical protein [Acidobacteriota bacterium]